MTSRRSKSSRRWLAEHAADGYTQRARQEGWRSRAVFKLSEIDKRDRLLHAGMTVVDLGASPGSWSQYAVSKLGRRGRVLALDLLPMEPLTGVEFIQGDFTEEAGPQALLEALDETPVDLVMSDMAPNISGVSAVDQPRARLLVELALELARQVLRPGGSLLVKAFQGAGFQRFVVTLRSEFGSLRVRKPAASRGRSREVYLLAGNYRM